MAANTNPSHVDPNADLDTGSAIPSGQDPAGKTEDITAEERAAQAEAEKTGDLTPSLSAKSADALDNLFEKVSPEGTGNPSPKGAATKPDVAAEAKAAADAKAAEDKAAADKATAADPAAAAKAAEDKAATDKATADAAEATKDLQAAMDKVELPPYVKPATVKSFENLKQIAKENAVKLTNEKKAIEAKLAEATEQLKKTGTVDPKIETELKELREHKANTVIENDPKWNEFDAKVTKNNDLIYARLTEAGMTETQIADIKKLGGPANVDWTKVEALPAHIKRLIDVKAVENETLIQSKKDAIAEAKKNSEAYFKAKQEKEAGVPAEQATQRKAAADEVLTAVDWAKRKDVPANASAEQKAALEAHNKAVDAVETRVKEALADTSPRMHGMLAVGTAYAYVLQDNLNAVAATLKTVAAERDAAQAELAKIKKASRGANPSSPAAQRNPPAKPKYDGSNFKVRPGDALDALRDEVVNAAE